MYFYIFFTKILHELESWTRCWEELKSAFRAESSEAAEGRHELGPVLLKEELLKVGSDLGQVRKGFGALDVEHRFEKVWPQLGVPPSEKKYLSYF